VSTPRIFTEQALGEGLKLQLEEGPSRHLAGTLRLHAEAEITLFDGRGGEYGARITSVERKRVAVEVLEHRATELESPLAMELGIAISRGERMDWVTQKATELGVARISPLITERTEVKLKGERLEKKLRHWQQITVSDCEQCGRNRLPQVNPLQSLESWAGSVQADCKLVLHHRSDTGIDPAASPGSAALLIGPEGGLAAAEIALAEENGFKPLTLGPRVMRTETAPLAALAILQHRYGDMV